MSKDRKRVESGDKVADVRRLRLQRMKRNNLCQSLKQRKKGEKKKPHLVKGSAAAVDLRARVKADSGLSPVEAPVPKINKIEKKKLNKSNLRKLQFLK